ncbi:unnamed protein product [Adineta steineri]|uniref:Uncharacterized protein n=1 Tax=Adineta steineri TaxID=433720 RepID=A0A813ZHB0_9BILA|nr:unnamed protein product [Adineta steineri]CAF3663507.1 unnamed protein product [Adineta steineri]
MDLPRRHRSTYLFLIIFPYLYIIYSYFFNSSSTKQFQPNYLLKPEDTGRVLIIYVWADTDIQSLGNLQFFIRYGVHESQRADYYFILQEVNKQPVNISSLPKLPPNAHYIEHVNECFDFGTFGWFLSKKSVNLKTYKYFIFMNASIRGPFLVAYFDDESSWWYHIYTKRLNDEVKLVGSTINCEHKPHVQSYILVTDHVGLAILINPTKGVFSCKKDYTDAVFNGEIGASQLILHANYQIASLQVKYQGYDFRKRENQKCNYEKSPIFIDKSVDTITHDPFELVFVKYRGPSTSFDSDLERRAFIYQRWLKEQPPKQEPKKVIV